MRCSHLDNDGIRCREKTRKVFVYHGEHEIYDGLEENRSGWVAIPFCKTHEIDHSPYKAKEFKRRKKLCPKL